MTLFASTTNHTHSRVRTQYSVLSTQYSVLSTQYSGSWPKLRPASNTTTNIYYISGTATRQALKQQLHTSPHYLGAFFALLTSRCATRRGLRATLQGLRATLQGLRATLQGRNATLQGRCATLQGRCATLQGRSATLQGRRIVARGSRAGIKIM
jgi:hypothetical protein